MSPLNIHRLEEFATGKLEWLITSPRTKPLSHRKVESLWTESMQTDDPRRVFLILRALYHAGDHRAEVRLANAFIIGEFDLPINISIGLCLLRSAAQKGSRHADAVISRIEQQMYSGLISADSLQDNPESESKRQRQEGRARYLRQVRNTTITTENLPKLKEAGDLPLATLHKTGVFYEAKAAEARQELETVQDALDV
jgi:hypothetical protein